MLAQVRNSIGFLATFAVSVVVLLVLCYRSAGSSYRAGLGEVTFGSGFVLLLIGCCLSALFFLVLVLISIVERKRNLKAWTFLKISASVALLLFVPVFFLHGPTESGYTQYAKGFLVRVDRECAEDEVRQWAKEFISTHRNVPKKSGYGEPDTAPEFIKRIYPFDDETRMGEFSWYIRVHNEVEFLVIEWGGALPGHWGLEIGSEELMLVSDKYAYRLEWKPGIYVWYEEG